MEMERKVKEAARDGDINKLHNLIKDEPLLLKGAAYSCDGGTPLHAACIGGHPDFVREVLKLNPEFATKLDEHGFTPLHIASANGDLEVVKELLKVGGHVCLVKGKEKRIPLHSAVIKGQLPVITQLLSLSLSDSISQVTVRGGTCFHLALKFNQFEAFKLLLHQVIGSDKEDVVNVRDQNGNTILHLAASRKQYEFVDLLLDKSLGYKGKLEVNFLNKKGLTPLDVLVSEGGDADIEEMLTLAGAVGGEEMQHVAVSQPQLTTNPSQTQSEQEQDQDRPKSASKRLQHYFKYDRIKDSPGKVRDSLLVISVLIATATYQAVLSPPGGVWQDDSPPQNQNSTSDPSGKPPMGHIAGQAVMGTHNPVSYGLFLFFNSTGFFMSLHMMDFLTLGLPLQLELRVALVALIATYNTCMVAITPSGWISTFFNVLSGVLLIVIKILMRVVRDYSAGWRRCSRRRVGSS